MKVTKSEIKDLIKGILIKEYSVKQPISPKISSSNDSLEPPLNDKPVEYAVKSTNTFDTLKLEAILWMDNIEIDKAEIYHLKGELEKATLSVIEKYIRSKNRLLRRIR